MTVIHQNNCEVWFVNEVLKSLLCSPPEVGVL